VTTVITVLLSIGCISLLGMMNRRETLTK
jgi:hypothetical protein